MSRNTQNVKISKKIVVINSLSALAARIVEISVIFWLQRYLILKIGTDEYSLLPVVMSITIFIPVLFQVMVTGVSRFCIEYYANNDLQSVTKVVSSQFPILLLISACLCTLSYFFVNNIESILNIPSGYEDDAKLMFLIVIISIAIRFPLIPFRAGFQIKQKFVHLNILRTSVEFFRIGLLFSLLFGVSPSVLWVVVASSVSKTLGVIIEAVYSRKLVPELKFQLSLFDWGMFRKVSIFGLWNLFGHMANKLKKAADPILLNLFSNPLNITCFHLANLISTHLQIISIYVLDPLQPVLIAMHAANDSDRIRRAFYRVNRYAILSFMFIATPILFYRSEVIGLYVGDEYQIASTVILLLLAGLPLEANSLLILRVAQAMDKLFRVTVATMGLQLFNVVLTIYLLSVHDLGAVGSAAATCFVIFAGQLFLMIPLSVKMVGGAYFDWLKRVLLPGIMPMGVSWLGYSALSQFIVVGCWGELFICSSVGSVVYLLSAYVLCLSADEKEDLIMFVRNQTLKILSRIQNVR